MTVTDLIQWNSYIMAIIMKGENMYNPSTLQYLLLDKVINSDKYIHCVGQYLQPGEMHVLKPMEGANILILVQKGMIALSAGSIESTQKAGNAAVLPEGVVATVKNIDNAPAILLAVYTKPLDLLFNDEIDPEHPYKDYFYSTN